MGCSSKKPEKDEPIIPIASVKPDVSKEKAPIQ